MLTHIALRLKEKSFEINKRTELKLPFLIRLLFSKSLIFEVIVD